MRILFRDCEAWVDLREESRTELEPNERAVLQAFEHALPNPRVRIPLGSDGVAEYVLLETGIWPYDGDGIRFAEYTLAVRGGESPLPWPAPSEEQKAPGRAALVRIRQAVDEALSDWESNDFAAVVQKLEVIEHEAHELIGPASNLINNYER